MGKKAAFPVEKDEEKKELLPRGKLERSLELGA